MDGTSQSSRKLRIAAALAALAAFAMNGAGHAESEASSAAPELAAAAVGPVFVPSEEALATPALPEPVAVEPESGQHLGSGVASYYGRQFDGRSTASGERFDSTQLTAAHRTLPFGSRVRVTNPANGRSVIVRINDRGPFHGGRTIDLSRAAAEEVGIVAAGHGTVELELLDG